MHRDGLFARHSSRLRWCEKQCHAGHCTPAEKIGQIYLDRVQDWSTFLSSEPIGTTEALGMLTCPECNAERTAAGLYKHFRFEHGYDHEAAFHETGYQIDVAQADDRPSKDAYLSNRQIGAREADELMDGIAGIRNALLPSGFDAYSGKRPSVGQLFRITKIIKNEEKKQRA